MQARAATTDAARTQTPSPRVRRSIAARRRRRARSRPSRRSPVARRIALDRSCGRGPCAHARPHRRGDCIGCTLCIDACPCRCHRRRGEAACTRCCLGCAPGASCAFRPARSTASQWCPPGRAWSREDARARGHRYLARNAPDRADSRRRRRRAIPCDDEQRRRQAAIAAALVRARARRAGLRYRPQMTFCRPMLACAFVILLYLLPTLCLRHCLDVDFRRRPIDAMRSRAKLDALWDYDKPAAVGGTLSRRACQVAPPRRRRRRKRARRSRARWVAAQVHRGARALLDGIEAAIGRRFRRTSASVICWSAAACSIRPAHRERAVPLFAEALKLAQERQG